MTRKAQRLEPLVLKHQLRRARIPLDSEQGVDEAITSEPAGRAGYRIFYIRGRTSAELLSKKWCESFSHKAGGTAVDSSPSLQINQRICVCWT